MTDPTEPRTDPGPDAVSTPAATPGGTAGGTSGGTAPRRGPILVTGAAGLLGHAVARRLIDRGTEVIAVDRVSGEIDGLAVRACDLGDVHRLHELASREGLGGVVHCGAHSGPMVARDHPASMVEVNVVGTANVLEVARVHGAARFVFASSATAYGPTDGPGPVPETTLARPGSLYAASKLAGEALVTAYAQQYGPSGVSLRLGWVYGPRRTTDCVVRTLLEDAQAERPTRFGFGRDFPRQLVHLDDAVRALVLALDADRPAQHVYNITGGTRVTLSEVGELVRQSYPRADIDFAPGPDPVDVHQAAFDLTAARRDLGYEPQVGLAEGVRRYGEWLASRTAPAVVA